MKFSVTSGRLCRLQVTYGMHFNYTGRVEFDPVKNTVGPVTRKVRRAG